ncbi:MAG: DUF2680 domain-containing protein [Clostridiales bacterium]|jgi:polyhydroxyalkanoate synthesis regulator phasin|nr:DUF2680 domain-containing protein [Clostridiales bacterium]
MRKGLVTALVLGLILTVAVPVLAGEATAGRFARDGGMGIGQGVTRAYIGELLKLDEEALRAARREGNSMIQIAESQGLGADEFVGKVVEFRKEQINALVAEGTITAEQAEQCAETMETRIQANLERVPEGQGKMMQNLQMQQNKQMRVNSKNR